MNYELYMGEALAEAQAAVARGERPHAAVAVLDEAMVARGHDRVRETDDPTAHAVIVALREAARRVGKDRLRDVTMFCTMEPCPMCVGALLAADVEALVYAIPNRTDGAAGTVLQLAEHPGLGRRVKVVSGIRRDEVEELYAADRRPRYARPALAEREGFEPSVLSHTAFRERHHQPLGHLSAREDTSAFREPDLGQPDHARH